MNGDDDGYNYDYEAIQKCRIFTIIIGSISIVFPLSVVVILIQRFDNLVRGKSMMYYILMIAIADTFTSFFISLGYPPPGIVCSIQGFFSFFFARMSWFYTDVLIFQLFYIVVFQQYFLNVTYMHIIVWTLNIILQFLPYSTGTRYGYGDEDDSIEKEARCFLSKGKGSEDNALKWGVYTFEYELIISLLIIIVLSIVVVFYSIRMKNLEVSQIYLAQRIKGSWSIVILYPLAMIVSWMPGVLAGLAGAIYKTKGDKLPPNHILLFDYLSAFNSMYGPLLALIFYTKTVDARRAWMYNLRCILNLFTNVNVDDRSSCSSILSIKDSEISSNFSIWSKIKSSFTFGSDKRQPLLGLGNHSMSTIQEEEEVNRISSSSNILRISEAL